MNEFVILKKSYSFSTCYKCGGSGVLKSIFRGMEFVKDCTNPNCEGGRIRHTITEEFPINTDRLKELKLIE